MATTYEGTNGSITFDDNGVITIKEKGPPEHVRVFRGKYRGDRQDQNREPTGQYVIVYGGDGCECTILVRDDCKVDVTIVCPPPGGGTWTRTIEGIPEDKKKDILPHIEKLYKAAGDSSLSLGASFHARLTAAGEISAHIEFPGAFSLRHMQHVPGESNDSPQPLSQHTHDLPAGG